MNQDNPILLFWKAFIIMLLFFMGFPALVLANNSGELSEDEIVKLLCSGKWHLSYMEMDGQHLDFPAHEVKANWTQFNADGTHNSEEMGEAYSGTWVYDHATKTLTTNDKDGKLDLIILKISEGEIQFSMMDEGKRMTVGMKK
ncbi:MAG: lipocalin family protein [Flammeovirgaceae bacterium]